MILTLEVMGEQAAQLGAGKRRVFNAIGGTIGRLPDNDWVLPDRYISGRHALIRFLNGRFFIEDTSTNGVFVNSTDNRVARTQAHPLSHGDVLFIDAYEISVSIEKGTEADAETRDPLAALKGRVNRDRPGRQERREERAPVKPTPHKDIEAGNATDDSVDRNSETQWFGLGEMSLPEPPPSAQLPKVVAVLPPEPAAVSTEGLNEISEQQPEVFAAMRLAFEALLKQFDPDGLQEEFDRRLKQDPILGVPAKLRYWNLYRDKYDAMTLDTDGRFQALFGDEFARAYAEQVEQLKSRGRNR